MGGPSEVAARVLLLLVLVDYCGSNRREEARSPIMAGTCSM